jgi:2-polyprenyl-6-methoxyphenol hydroxylase-like FAD-dependent oxidoreductase
VAFGARWTYLHTFYDNLKDKSKVLCKKNVVSVEQSKTGVTVTCEDGTSYGGDILAGSDGVRSKVRKEIWEQASSAAPDLVEHDKNGTCSSSGA